MERTTPTNKQVHWCTISWGERGGKGRGWENEKGWLSQKVVNYPGRKSTEEMKGKKEQAEKS